MLVTSLSDTDDYNGICRAAVEDPAVFDTFRRHPAYCRIVETMRAQDGLKYGHYALSDDPSVTERIEEYRRNESVGTPVQYDYRPIGLFAPTTLRYIKFAVDLKLRFGSMAGWRIAEIGGGYGGQCRILSVDHQFALYRIFDLPMAGQLALKYLSKFDVPNVEAVELVTAPNEDYDLVISAYALSEIITPLQLAYLHKVCSRARHGFMMWNFLSGVDSLAFEHVLAALPPATVIRDYPALPSADARRRNALIVW